MFCTDMTHQKKLESHKEHSIDEKLASLKKEHAPMPTHASDKEISVQLNIPITKNFISKLPFLFVILLLFIFSAVLFDKANFKIADMLDLSHFAATLGKFYSLGFILFLIVFSITIALSIFYGNGISPWLAMLTLPVSLIASLVMGLAFFPALLLPFIALGVVVSSAAFFASIKKDLDWGRIWNVADQALLVLLLLTAVIVFAKASANQQVYSDALIGGVVGYTVDSSGGSVGFIVSGDTVEKTFTEDFLKQMLPKTTMEKVLKASFGAVVMQDAQYTSLIKELRSELVLEKNDIASAITAKLPEVTADSGIVETVQGAEFLKPLLDNLPLLLALSALMAAASVAFVIKILSTAFAFGLFKYLG
ncbi:MAG: hypothetical protein ABH803_03635 [Candidatus Micrarchaeota archaeon]